MCLNCGISLFLLIYSPWARSQQYPVAYSRIPFYPPIVHCMFVYTPSSLLYVAIINYWCNELGWRMFISLYNYRPQSNFWKQAGRKHGTILIIGLLPSFPYQANIHIPRFLLFTLRGVLALSIHATASSMYSRHFPYWAIFPP